MRRSAVPVAVLLLVLLTVAAPAPAGAAACAYEQPDGPAVPVTAVAPVRVVVGLTPVEVTTAVTVPDDCTDDLDGWRVTWAAGALTFTGDDPTDTADPGRVAFRESAGTGAGTLTTRWDSGAVRRTGLSVQALRRTSFGDTFNAVGEPLPAGGALLLKAALGRVDWAAGRYVPYAGRTVRVQWRADGQDTFETYGHETTDAQGRIRAYWTTGSSGTWRLQYAGNTVSGRATSKADHVAVLD